MTAAAQVAEDFFAAWTGKDFDRARALLHDDLSFRGPIDSFDDADAYLRAIQGLSQIVTGADKRKVFVDGDVCVIYDLKTAPVPSAPTAEWYHIRDGRIASIQVFFDARPFAPLFEGR
jgi:ketosteroid isomerase-like protein